jgi:CHAT domain-containing protein
LKKALIALVLLPSSFLYSRIIHVPQEFLTIKSAVSEAHDADIVEVDDGYYFEKNIIISKAIRVRAKNVLRVVISGTGTHHECIFIIRAKAEIDGFILKDSDIGIEQRFSPNVSWKAHDMAILNMRGSGLSVNDTDKNIGSALFKNIVIDNCGIGVGTNDAGTIEVENAFITNCDIAFGGSNHINFAVRHALTWNCGEILWQDDSPTIFPASHQIKAASDVFFLDRFLIRQPNIDLGEYCKNFFSKTGWLIDANTDLGKRWWGLIEALLADVFLTKDSINEANELFLRSARHSEEGVLRDILLRSQFALAQIAVIRRDFRNALDSFRKSVSLIDSISERLPLWFYKPNFFSDKAGIYEAYIDFLFSLHQKEPKAGYDREAFLAAEKTKGFAVFPGIKELISGNEADNKSKIQNWGLKIASEIAATQKLIIRTSDPANRRALFEKLESNEDEFIAWLIQIKKISQKNGFISHQQPSPLREIQKRALSNDTALIEYFISGKTGYAFLLTQKAFLFHRIKNSIVLRSWVPNYLQFLSFPEPKDFASTEGGRKLYDLLISPFAGELSKGIKKIIIVPSGILRNLPFETLIRNDTRHSSEAIRSVHIDIPYLINTWEFSYALSASHLLDLEKNDNSPRLKMDLLAIAGRPGVFLQQNPSPTSLFSTSLPYAVREVEAVSSLFNRDRVSVLTGRFAGEAGFKKLGLQDYYIIHIAAHGLFDDNNWFRSSLLLGANSDDLEDGILQPIDILNLHIKADLVTLSACRSAEGKIGEGEGLLGLSAPFLMTGTRSLIATLWSIEDRSTEMLMRIFYTQLGEKKTKSDALRAAKLWMLNAGYGHPFYWAAFILIGASDHSMAIFRPHP